MSYISIVYILAKPSVPKECNDCQELKKTIAALEEKLMAEIVAKTTIEKMIAENYERCLQQALRQSREDLEHKVRLLAEMIPKIQPPAPLPTPPPAITKVITRNQETQTDPPPKTKVETPRGQNDHKEEHKPLRNCAHLTLFSEMNKELEVVKSAVLLSMKIRFLAHCRGHLMWSSRLESHQSQLLLRQNLHCTNAHLLILV